MLVMHLMQSPCPLLTTGRHLSIRFVLILVCSSRWVDWFISDDISSLSSLRESGFLTSHPLHSSETRDRDTHTHTYSHSLGIRHLALGIFGTFSSSSPSPSLGPTTQCDQTHLSIYYPLNWVSLKCIFFLFFFFFFFSCSSLATVVTTCLGR